MNIKKNSLRTKTFIYFVIFSTITLLFLWLFQSIFIKVFYEKYQIKDVKNIGNIIVKTNHNNLISYLENISYEKDMCIEFYSSNQIYSFNTNNKNCLLNTNYEKIIKIKRSLLSSPNKLNLIKIENPNDNIKSIIYGIRLNNDSIVILNTQIEDINTVNNLIKGQLIYITFIVIIIAIIVSYYVSKILNKPILDITDKARLMAQSDFSLDNNTYQITELEELKNVLNYARSEIKNTDELRRDLMANVSHDLKTPLTLIKSYAEMAKDLNNNNEEKRQENLDIIISETDRLTLLVNDILNLSKLQNNLTELKFQKFDLVNVLNDIIKKYQIIKETENYIFILNIPDKAIVYADKLQVTEVLYNLINNAINYTGKDLTVTINIKENKKEYLVEIIDTGKGLTKEECNLIWNKYYKNEKNHIRNKVGTGLGLSIVKNILEKHNFKYGVKSKINKGSNFYFYIKR